MSGQVDPFKAAVRSWVEEQRRSLGEHPSFEELLDYRSGRIPYGEAERLQDHLSLCPDCCEYLLSADDFFAKQPSGESFAEVDVEAAWEEFRKRFELEPAESHRSLPSPAFLRRSWQSPRLWRAVAAAFLLALLFRPGPPSEPTAQVTIIDLLPDGGPVRSSSGAPETVRIPAETERFVFILNRLDPRNYSSYRVTLEDGVLRTIWSADGLQPAQEGSFVLEFPRRSLPVGRCQFRLYGQEGTREALVAVYPVRFE
jgi:hypothetical protein